MPVKKDKVSKKDRRTIVEGIVVINAGFNNTHITFTDKAGNVFVRASTGMSGFKGSRKSTPYAAQVTAEKAARSAYDLFGLRRVELALKGPGAGRETAAKAVAAVGIEVGRVYDDTPLAHGGRRLRKQRRV